MWRKLRLILWKNLVIRKRHWLLTLAEISIPILLFTLIAYGRSKITGLSKVEIQNPEYHEVLYVDNLFSHLPVGELNLYYAPYNIFTEKIIKHVQETFQIPGDDIRDFSSKEQLLQYISKNLNSTNTIIAVNFNEDRVKLNYDISIFDKYVMWQTEKLFSPLMSTQDISGSSSYIYKGFVAMQIAINQAFISLYKGEGTNAITFTMQEFPSPPRVMDSGLSQLFIHFLPLITIFSFIFLCPAVLKRVGEEKHSGTKEFLKMVGMQPWMLWLGWFIHALISNLFSIIVIIILMKVPFWGVPYPPIEHSNGLVLFVFLFLYCMAAVTFCFFIATLFNSPSIATVIGILFWIFSYFIPKTIISAQENSSWKYKILFAIFPNMALHYGYSAISIYEMREVGIQWNNICQSGSGGEDDITMGNVLAAFIFDMIFFMLLTIYIENVKPGEYGIAKPSSYPLLNLKYFMQKLFISRQLKHCSSSVSLNQCNDTMSNLEKGREGTACIEIVNLRKKFYNIVAVENLSMTIYENYITVLLGHNGAGKTTTMSIVTGMINSSSGQVLVNGKNIRKHTNEVRANMGLCPQHNLLFPDLTVMEHLRFFSMLRGKSYSDAISEAETLLGTFNMLDKKNVMAATLSGGMKRKLCLGMALVGNPKILILDEPTSGMDPESRRKIWDLLLEQRKTKTILITTHFMEEADVLGDRIAIMANGCLQCFGTPMELKNRFNTGYHLSLMLESRDNFAKINEIIMEFIPETELLRDNGENIVFLLPLNKKHLYKGLLETLENDKTLRIANMGLSLTTLNDVFLKAKDEIDGKVTIKLMDNNLKRRSLPSEEKGSSSLGKIFHSLILKRFYFFKRKFFWYIPSIVVAICIFLVTMSLDMTNSDNSRESGPKLNLTLNIYGKTGVVYGGSEENSNLVIKQMRNYYHDEVIKQNGEPFKTDDVPQGIIEKGIENIVYYKLHMIAAAEFTTEKNDIVVNMLYSNNALHAIPISINLAMNAIVKSLLNDSFSIAVSNEPLKPLRSGFAPSELSEINVGILWLILVPLAMLFLMSNFIIFPNIEVSTNFIQIQTMAGVRTYIYWLMNIIYDFILSVVKLGIVLLFMFLANVIFYGSIVFTAKEYEVMFAVFLCYMVVSLPYTYLFSYRKTIATGFTLFLILGMFIGITPTVIIRAMELSHDEYYMRVATYLKHLFICTCPHFALTYICVKFSQKYVENFNWRYMNPDKKKYLCNVESNPCCYTESSTKCRLYQSYFLNDTLGIASELKEMTIAFLLYFTILWFLNTQCFKRICHKIKYWRNSCGKNGFKKMEPIPTDENDTLCAKNVSKTYGNKQIVNNLKLTLKKQKCFGLLGVNGAGKTTTFRMLTKEIFFDQGNIIIKSGPNSVIPINQAEYTESIGYCPQEDCLNFFLTGKELLMTLGMIRGFSKDSAEKMADFLLEEFDLKKYANKSCLEYSGGNKRKLCSCIAFLGSPTVIMLDEPTNGVDPSSRRNFWNILSERKKQKNVSLLLCSHSMEECEALCDEIGIMKHGTIEAQGTLPYLKQQFQKGYTIEVKLKSTMDSDLDSINSVKNEIENEANAELKDAYADLLHYRVKDEHQTLSKLFDVMEQLKGRHANIIDDYTINQISLEDIFLSVAKENN